MSHMSAPSPTPPPIPVGVFARALFDASCEVYRDMTDSIDIGIERFEETSTQHNLLSVGRKLPPRAGCSVTRGNEHLTGADWLWEVWLGGASWFAIRFQAKRLLNSNQYDIGYRSGKTGKLQVDLLIDECRRKFIVPAYVFYNDSRVSPWASAFCRMAPYNYPSLGVVFAHARGIKSLVDASAAPREPWEIAPAARLWPCMIDAYRRGCCKEGTHLWRHSWGPWPDWFDAEDDLGLAEAAALSLRIRQGGPDNPYVKPELPEYARLVRDGGQFDPREAFPAGVGAVTVLNQFPQLQRQG